MNQDLINSLGEIKDVYSDRILAIGNSAVLNLLLLVEEASNRSTLNNITHHLDEIYKYLPKDLIKRSATQGEAIHDFLISSYFISLISYTEFFLYDLQKKILEYYPLKIKNFVVDSKEIIILNDSTQVKTFIIEKYLEKLFYESPKEYKKILFNIISADENYIYNEWAIFVEMKARRDIGVHNNWFKNDRYIAKLNAFKIDIPAEDYLLPSQDYLNFCITTLGKIANKLMEHCLVKF